MSSADQVFRALQRKAREDGRESKRPPPTQEYLIRYGLEGFLQRLNLTPHGSNFVLKGGLLAAVYNARRPTKDADTEAVGIDVSPEVIERIVRDAVAADVDDGLAFDLSTLDVHEIRDQATYQGLRMRITAALGDHEVKVVWDVSAGDPIVPPPHKVTLKQVLGGEITMLAYRPETVIAEKGVTILERGITSTRWRDFVDIPRLADANPIDRDALLKSARAVAAYRNVRLSPITPHVEGYGAVMQAKWAAWRRKNQMEDVSAQELDVQMRMVSAVVDPVFTHGPDPSGWT